MISQEIMHIHGQIFVGQLFETDQMQKLSPNKIFFFTTCLPGDRVKQRYISIVCIGLGIQEIIWVYIDG